ncbi:hypothetical protein J3S90_15435 [Flavobacterium sp. P4023]|uniref:PH domain-containing protein n=1 Tax=Flavobacterium flabelliforme TaxID=2816119 RepID=A0ABS5CX51_9FLAO|nr:hypothetical protein [Flavobacterium flabelliforme]MBP4143197.1 hypothetical protein [Flavobacterium flabelliforme]
MENYIYVEKVSLWKKIIGNLFLICGIFGLIFINVKIGPQYIFLWVFLCFVGVFFISTEGLEINFNKTNYRKIISMYGINYGLSWKYYPKINYFALVETNIKQTIGGRTFNSTATATLSSKMVKINLFDDYNKHITLYIANNRNEAIKIGEKLQKAHNVEMKKNFD